MNTALTLDPKFVQIATPVLSEFGFSGIQELVREQVMMMLQSKVDHYEAEIRLYQSRYGKPYEQVAIQLTEAGVEDFDLDDTLQDWRFAREAAELYRAKMLELQNA